MGIKYQFVRLTGTRASGTSYIYGIYTLPAYMKKSGVTITATVGGSTTGYGTAGITARYKLDSGTATYIAGKTQTISSSNGGAVTSYTASVTGIDLTNVTTFKIQYQISFSNTGGSSVKLTGNADIVLSLPDVASEDKITAAKVTELATLLGASATAATTSAITKTPYATLATSAGAAAFDANQPKKTNIDALVTAVNGKTITGRAWTNNNASSW